MTSLQSHYCHTALLYPHAQILALLPTDVVCQSYGNVQLFRGHGVVRCCYPFLIIQHVCK